mmetsp:Transcript_475/g.995  ORF Transcript_475/g.995 Transcript_475/m.995 type:complete len:212 (+) Transcript_475:65-700(+)
MTHALGNAVFLLASCLGVYLAAADEATRGSDSLMVAQFYPVKGVVTLPDGLRPSMVQITLTVNAGERMKTLPREDGSFTFNDVPPGTHQLEVVAMGFFYPPVRVDVSSRHNGKIHAALAEDRRVVLSPGLVIDPVRKMDYFEKRQEFSIWSIVSNPMMMMMIFTVVCVVIFSNIDPETIKELNEQAQAEKNRAFAPKPATSGSAEGAKKRS